MSREKQAREIAEVFLRNQHYLEKVSPVEIDWVTKNGAEAVYIFFEAVKLRAKHIIREMQLGPLAPWKRINSTVFSNRQLLEKVREKYHIGKWSCYFITKKTFNTRTESDFADLVILPLEYFGFREEPRTDVFLDEEFLEKWSLKNLHNQKISLCYPEDAFQLRMQYDDQPCGEILWIAMRPLTDSFGNHRIFCVRRRNHGRRWVDACPARPGARWSLGVRFVFRLCKL